MSKIVLFLNVRFKTMWNFVKIIFANTTNEAVVFKFLLDTIHLVSQCSESVNNEALNNCQENEGDEQIEREVKDNSVVLEIVTIRRFNLVSNTSSSSDTFVEVEDKAGEH